MARKNTPSSYKCSVCSTLGHNKRTCPTLGLAPKAKPVKKPRAKKVAAVEAEVTAPVVTVEVPVLTEADEAEVRDLLAQIEAEEATEAPVEVEACDVEEAFDADADEEREPTDEELAEIEAEDEAEALALLAEIEALAG
jgi:hypothetical protein